MATYHLSFKNGKKAQGKLHASYICRENKYSKHNYEELFYKESGNMPEWVESNTDFWNAADLHERLNGRTYSEIEIALPNELTHEENIELTKRYVEEVIGKDHPYTFALHDKSASLDKSQKQPHAHIMFSERKLDGIERSEEDFFKRYNPKNPELGGAKKDPEWNKKNKIQEVRKHWEVFHNRELEKRNIDKTISADSLVVQRERAIENGDVKLAQELDRIPQVHMGPKAIALREKAEEQIIQPRIEQSPEDAQEIRYDYYMNEEQNARVLSYYLIENINELTQELKCEAELLEEQSKHNSYKYGSVDKEVSKEVIVSVQELQEVTNTALNEVTHQRMELQNERDEINKKVISEARAQSMAESIYFKNEPAKVNKEIKVLEDKMRVLAQKVRVHDEKPVPSMINFNARKEHKVERERLVEEHTRVKSQREKLLETKAYYQKELKKPEVQQKIKATKEGILEKNKPIKELAQEKKTQYDQMSGNIEDLTKLKFKLQRIDKQEQVKLEHVEKSNLKYEVSRSASRILNEISENRNVGMRVRVSDERGY